MDKKIIFYTILIITILVLVFLGQQAYSRAIGKTLISAATDKASEYMSEGSNWVMSNIYPKISAQVQKRGEMIKTEVNQTKQKVTEDIPKKIENYFSGIANSIKGKDNTSCQTSNGQ
jgi:hypothetical protein